MATDPIARQAGFYYTCPADGRMFRTLADCKAHLPAPAPTPPPAPVPVEYTLTIKVDPRGGGRTSPGVGSHKYAEKARVRVEAWPNDGFEWVEWQRLGRRFTTNSGFNVDMIQDYEFTAVFQALAPPPALTGSVSVSVHDHATKAPIAGATLRLDGMTRTTDSKGRASFDGLTPATYILETTYAGYTAQRATVTVQAGATTSVSVPMAKTVDEGMFAPLIAFLRGFWDLLFGTLRGLTETVSAPIKGMVDGFVKEFARVMAKGSPEEETAQAVKEATEQYLKRIRELTEPIYKGSPELEVAREKAGELLTALLGVVVTVEGATTIADQIQPFRGIGIPAVARSMMRTMGMYGLAAEVATMPARVGMISALQYYYNKAFTPRIPSLPDLITMLVREVLTPPEYTEFAAWHGESKAWADRRWAAHWVLPGMRSIVDGFHRGVLTAAERDKFLVWHDFQPTPRPGIKLSDTAIMAKLYKELIPRVDLRRAWELGAIDDKRLLKGYEDLGYEDDAPLMATIQKAVALSAEIDMLRREYLSWYERGLMTEAQLVARFKDLQTLRPREWYWIQLGRLRKARRAQEPLPAILRLE